MTRNRRSSRKRLRTLAGAMAFVCASSACDPIDVAEKGVGDASVSSATGSVIVGTTAANVPLVVSGVNLHLGTLTALSDRDDSQAVPISLATPLSFVSSSNHALTGEVPATYGRLELGAVDTLEISTAIGTILVDFGTTAPPIEVRCPGQGAYLGVAGQIGFGLTLDLTAIVNALTTEGSFPPVLPTHTVTDPNVIASIYAALAQDLSLVCTE